MYAVRARFPSGPVISEYLEPTKRVLGAVTQYVDQLCGVYAQGVKAKKNKMHKQTIYPKTHLLYFPLAQAYGEMTVHS